MTWEKKDRFQKKESPNSSKTSLATKEDSVNGPFFLIVAGLGLYGFG